SSSQDHRPDMRRTQTTSPTRMRQSAQHAALQHLGHRVWAGKPVFDRQDRCWHVPLFCSVAVQGERRTVRVQIGEALWQADGIPLSFPNRLETQDKLREERQKIAQA